jgi:hypothetical protein
LLRQASFDHVHGGTVYRLIVPVLLLLASHVHAQDPIRVLVSHSGSDAVGGQLAYEVREVIRRSAGYQLGTEEGYALRISLVSLDTEENQSGYKGNRSAVSVAYSMYNYQPYKAGDPQTWRPIHLSHAVHIVGTQRTEETAKDIIADLEQEFEGFKQSARRDLIRSNAN